MVTSRRVKSRPGRGCSEYRISAAKLRHEGDGAIPSQPTRHMGNSLPDTANEAAKVVAAMTGTTKAEPASKGPAKAEPAQGFFESHPDLEKFIGENSSAR